MAQEHQTSMWFDYYQQPAYNMPVQCRDACCQRIKWPAPYRPCMKWGYLQEDTARLARSNKLFKHSSLNYMPVGTYLQFPQIQSMTQADFGASVHNASRYKYNNYDNSSPRNYQYTYGNGSHTLVHKNLQKLDVRQFLANWKDDDESNEIIDSAVDQQINLCNCPMDSYQTSNCALKGQNNFIGTAESRYQEIDFYNLEHNGKLPGSFNPNKQQVEYVSSGNIDSKKLPQPYALSPKDCYYALESGNHSSNFVPAYNNNHAKKLRDIPHSPEYRNSLLLNNANKMWMDFPYEREIEKVPNPNINYNTRYRNGEISYPENRDYVINSAPFTEGDISKRDNLRIPSGKYDPRTGVDVDKFYGDNKLNEEWHKYGFHSAHHQYNCGNERIDLIPKSDNILVKPTVQNITGMVPLNSDSDPLMVQGTTLEFSCEDKERSNFNNYKDTTKDGFDKIENSKGISSSPDVISEYTLESRSNETIGGCKHRSFKSGDDSIVNDDTHLNLHPQDSEEFSNFKFDIGNIHKNIVATLKNEFKDISFNGSGHSDINSSTNVVFGKNKSDENVKYLFNQEYCKTPNEMNLNLGEIIVPTMQEGKMNVAEFSENSSNFQISEFTYNDLQSCKSVIGTDYCNNTVCTINCTGVEKSVEVKNNKDKKICTSETVDKIVIEQSECIDVNSAFQNNFLSNVEGKHDMKPEETMDSCNIQNSNVELKSKLKNLEIIDNCENTETVENNNICAIIKASMKCSEKEVISIHDIKNSLESIALIYEDINFSDSRVDAFLKLHSDCIQDLSNVNLSKQDEIMDTPLNLLRTLKYDNIERDVIRDIIQSDNLNENNTKLSFKKRRSEANKCNLKSYINSSRLLPTNKSDNLTCTKSEQNEEEKKMKDDNLEIAKRMSLINRGEKWKKLGLFKTIIKMNLHFHKKYCKTSNLIRSRKKDAADKIVLKYKHIRNQFNHKRELPNKQKFRINNTRNNKYSHRNVQVKDDLVIILDGILDHKSKPDLVKKHRTKTGVNWVDFHHPFYQSNNDVLELSSGHRKNMSEEANDNILSEVDTWPYQNVSVEPTNVKVKCSSNWNQIFKMKKRLSHTELNLRPAKLELVFGSNKQQEQWQIINQYNDNHSKVLKVKRLLIRRKSVPRERVPRVVIKKTKGEEYKSFIKEYELQPTVRLERCSHLDKMAIERVHANKFNCRACSFPFNSQEELNDHHCRKGHYCLLCQ